MRRVVLTIALLACGAWAPVPVQSARTTTMGTQFTAPPSWFLVRGPWGTTLTPPEITNHIAVIDVPKAASASDAVNQAWQLYHPGFARALKVATRQPARDGWEEAWEYDYETAPQERLVLFAAPQRHAAQWTVALVEIVEPVFEKRAADVRSLLQSIRPAGYQRETFAGRTPHRMDPARVAALQSFLRDGMQAMDVPGAGLALIDHGHVVFEGGLGVRERGKPARVDAHTLFLIASNTKGLTTLLLAELADKHQLRWDEKVTEAYPGFALGNTETTQRVLIRHLVCACTGLPRQDMEWLLNSSATTPASRTFATLAGMQPTTPFGQTYQYSNLMAAAAGYVAGHIVYPGRELGDAYDTAMQNMVFSPLGMRDTTFSFPHAMAGDHASPHDDDMDGHPAVASMDANETIVSARPAGGAWSSAHDMILYVRNELTGGVLPDGKRLVSATNLLIRRAPGVTMSEDQHYGMGLANDTSFGVEVIHHGGSLPGYKSDIIAIPSAQVGAVILLNSETGRRLLRPFMRRLLELLYDGKPHAEADVAALASSLKAERQADRKRMAIPADPGLAAILAAHYENAALGHIDVRRQGADVVFDFGAWHSRVASRRNADGSISFVTIDPGEEGVEFMVSSANHRRGLILRDGQHEYAYAAAR